MMRTISLKVFTVVPICIFSFFNGVAQDHYAEFSATLLSLYRAKTADEHDRLWNALVGAHKIPLVAGDSIAFLYRGEGKSVTWMGDFNGWGSDKSFNNKGTRIPETDIWILKTSLPPDARVDYKILINERQFILDPANPSCQWSGVGGGSLNSELRMPAWKQDPLTIRIPDAPRGKVERDLLFSGRELGYQMTYSIYTPPAHDAGKVYPIVYVTDGYEYMHERMGNMIAVLDNLIYLEKMEPVIAVFIDHREPVNRSMNRRMQELPMNDVYLDFILGELLPSVEQKFSAGTGGLQRAVIGSSIGGLSAAWLCFSRPDLFDRAGIQSPAFWFKPDIYALCSRAQKAPEKIFLSTGRIHDAEEAVRKIRDILDSKEYAYAYEAVNQGHSWGNWRDLLDEMLVYLFPVSN